MPSVAFDKYTAVPPASAMPPGMTVKIADGVGAALSSAPAAVVAKLASAAINVPPTIILVADASVR
jgi:hypothetical protein